MQLKGKSALVTGSTSGIGLAMAEALAKAGADLCLNGLGGTAMAQAQVARHGGRVVYHGADMTRPTEIAAMVAEAERAFGKLDIVVNNAGIQHVAPLEDFPTERWDAIIAINLSAPFHVIRAALPGMKARKWGRIVNIASAHGLVASVQKSAYVAAKHGLVGLTKAVALETAETGVTCNAICPGWVLTPLVQKQVEARAQREGLSQSEAARALLAEKQPSKTFVTTEKLAELLLFLLSEGASEMRGSIITMDGGWTAQ